MTDSRTLSCLLPETSVHASECESVAQPSKDIRMTEVLLHECESVQAHIAL